MKSFCNVLGKTVIFNYAYQGRKDCDPGNFHEKIMTEALKNERTKRKRTVTKHINQIKQLMAEDESKETIKEETTTLKAIFKAFTEAHEAFYGTLKEDNELDESEVYYTAVQRSYIELLNDVKAFAQKEDDNESCSTSSTSGGITKEEMHYLVNLPKVTLEPFDGDPLRYHEFMAVFEQNVGGLPGEDAAKLSRLLEYTTGGARDAIRKCALLGGTEGYPKAKQILKARFGDDHVVTEKIIEELRKGKPIKSAGDLQTFADGLQNSFAILVKMGKLPELDTQSAIIEVLGRLQPFIQLRWKNRALETKKQQGRYPDFFGFVDFIVEVATEVNDPVYGKVDTRKQASSGNERKPRQHSYQTKIEQQPTRQAQNITQKWKEPPCVLCGESHRLWYCDSFKQKTPQERLETVLHHKLCENCLRNNHSVENCKKQSVCSVPGCGKKHTKFLHQIDKTTSYNVSTSENVFMPVVPIVINDVYQTYALLDSASTTSFCVKNIADKLGIKSKKVTYNLCTLVRKTKQRQQKQLI